jgi:2-haloacid dehalogenase
MDALDFDRFEVLTFDCYGTLIDWEAGILAALRPMLGQAAGDVTDDALLERYAVAEARIEAGPYRRYREVLARGAEAVSRDLSITPNDEVLAAFGGSVGDWPPFPDSPGALARLHERYRLAVITNCDDDLFAASARRLGVTFDEVVTAQQAGAYKPSHLGFELMFERLGVPRDRILHVAQSLYHDHVPARALGLTSAWIDRRHDRPGSGATPPAEAAPAVTEPSMQAFADLALG